MKKALLIVLVLALCAAPVHAAEWQNGCSSAKPYTGVPEVDLETTLGYLMMYPGHGLNPEHYCQKLLMYLPRTDVEAGDGQLYLYTPEGGEELQIAMTDATLRAMTEAELNALLWGDGCCFEITLPYSLTVGESYYVLADEGCITAMDGAIRSTAIVNETKWAFTLEGDYGVSGMHYTADVQATTTLDAAATEETASSWKNPEAGDIVTFDLILGGDAVMAALYQLNDSVDFEQTYFEASATITGSVLAEAPEWGVVFFDGEGQELERVRVN